MLAVPLEPCIGTGHAPFPPSRGLARAAVSVGPTAGPEPHRDSLRTFVPSLAALTLRWGRWRRRGANYNDNNKNAGGPYRCVLLAVAGASSEVATEGQSSSTLSAQFLAAVAALSAKAPQDRERAIAGISSISTLSSDARDALVEGSVLAALSQVCSCGSARAQVAAAAIVRNITAGEDRHREAVMQAGLLGPLMELLRGARPASQWMAAAALGHLAGGTKGDEHRDAIITAGALEPLCQMCWNTMPETRQQAEVALEQIGGSSQLPRFRDAVALCRLEQGPGAEAAQLETETETGASVSGELPRFGEQAYWDERFVKEDHYEWIAEYRDLEGVLRKACPNPAAARVLNLGCGTSRISEEMHDAGFKNLVNADISELVIEKMRARNADSRPEMVWCAADALDLGAAGFESGSFDMLLDKGTTDAMACSRSAVVVARLLGEVSRVLRVGGIYLMVSLNEGNLDFLRMPHLAFEVDITRLDDVSGGPTAHVAICRKRPEADDVLRERQPDMLQWAASFDSRFPGMLEVVARHNAWESM
ncbi:unnamed protein product [Polarella glacialis]|uniref:Methyltransferase domain-containing protein n=1 Tax=Polarella glacialis TaxID=89957 RepID=A0A813GZQ5_POLGL|nr:unnamed protein product [Polarella glacialis]